MDVVVYSLEETNNNNNNNKALGEQQQQQQQQQQLWLGAIQEDGVLSPLSAWTDEPAFGDSIEFLVDEADRFLLARETQEQRQREEDEDKEIATNSNSNSNNDANKTTTIRIGIRIHHLLSEAELSYGARQCPRGPHNPHGEESELLYYIDRHLIDRFRIPFTIKPELEILW